MFLTDNYGSSLSPFSLLPFNSKKTHPLPSKSFDEALIARLKSLLPIPSPSPSIPLAWLTLAVDLLSLTISDAAALVSDPSLSSSDRDSHLDAGDVLLDACNAISAQIDRLLRARLLVRFALHLLSSPDPPENIRRARESIKEWEESLKQTIRGPAGDLNLKQHHIGPPRGRISAVRRAIYAVNAVSSLVAGAVLAILGGGEKGDLAGIRVSGEFPWACAFNEVVEAVAGKLPVAAGELVAVEAHVRRLAAVVDGEDEGEKAERLQTVSEEAEKATDELTDGLERLSNAVSGLFRAALCTRNAALQSLRIGQQKCK